MVMKGDFLSESLRLCMRLNVFVCSSIPPQAAEEQSISLIILFYKCLVLTVKCGKIVLTSSVFPEDYVAMDAECQEVSNQL